MLIPVKDQTGKQLYVNPDQVTYLQPGESDQNDFYRDKCPYALDLWFSGAYKASYARLLFENANNRDAVIQILMRASREMRGD